MTNLLRKKLARLQKILKGYKKVICAFSGGVDSTLLLKCALITLGRENCLAVTFVSPTYSISCLKEVKHLLRLLGAPHLFILTDELRDKRFRANPPQRCYFCKLAAYKELQGIKEFYGASFIIEGTNADDLKDYRPGRKALKELNIKSPFLLAGIRKKEIRALAKRFSLPNYDKPPNPCLASRIPFFNQITEAELVRVEKGEEELRQIGLQFFRLRSEGKTARIETNPKNWDKVIKKRGVIIPALKKLGYRFITLDLEGYQPSGLRWKRS